VNVRLMHGNGDQGVLFAVGEVMGGMVMYIEAGCLNLYYNGFGEYHSMLSLPIEPGERCATLEYEATGKRRGRGRLRIDEDGAGGSGDWQDLSPTLMYGFHEGLDIGIDRRAPVSWALRERHGSFRYTGQIRDVVIDSGPLAPDSALVPR